MDVFLVPIGADRHGLYCEAAHLAGEPAGDTTPGSRTLWTRARDIFRRALAEGEEEQRREAGSHAPRHGRVRRAITMRLADAVAEQRLLWHLRHETEAGLVIPDDIDAPRAIDLARAELTTDFSRHLRWCIIDALLAIASIPVALVPGPNVIGYYFVFRAVGHLYSMRGARHGLTGVTWRCRPSPHLTALRAALTHAGADRAREVEAVARALDLDGLGAFIDHTAD